MDFGSDDDDLMFSHLDEYESRARAGVQQPQGKLSDVDNFIVTEMASGNYDSLSEFVVQHSKASPAPVNARPSTADMHAAVFPPPGAPRNNHSAPASLFGSIGEVTCVSCGYTDTPGF